MFPQFIEFLEANQAIAPSLVLRVHAVGAARDGADRAGEPRDARRSRLPLLDGSRHRPAHRAARARRARLPLRQGAGRRCCSTAPAAPITDIHPADFSDLLGRYGIDLIAEKIESEATVVDLLDYDVRFGQGFLFSPPRPVRPEVLQGIAGKASVRRHRAPNARRPRSGPGLAAERAPEVRMTARARTRRCRVRRATGGRARSRSLRAGWCAARSSRTCAVRA